MKFVLTKVLLTKVVLTKIILTKVVLTKVVLTKAVHTKVVRNKFALRRKKIKQIKKKIYLLLFGWIRYPRSGIRDPGSGMGKSPDPRSGRNIPDLQHWKKAVNFGYNEDKNGLKS